MIFGGFGRYYDRNNFNNTVDEISRTINPIGVFRFSRERRAAQRPADGGVEPGLSDRDGLLAAGRHLGRKGLPELFAVKNDAQAAGQRPVQPRRPPEDRRIWQASLTASYIRGRNGYTNLFATRNNNGLGDCCNTAPVMPFGYANALIGYDGLDTRYKAIYFTLDKNYTKSSGWGFNLAYTLSKGEQNGNDLFSLDATVPDAYGWRAEPGDERHRVVISGIVDLPLGFQFSTLSTFGSGHAYQVTDARLGFDNGQLKQTAAYPVKNCIKGVFAFCEVNMTLAKKIASAARARTNSSLRHRPAQRVQQQELQGVRRLLQHMTDPLDAGQDRQQHADPAAAHPVPRRLQVLILPCRPRLLIGRGRFFCPVGGGSRLYGDGSPDRSDQGVRAGRGAARHRPRHRRRRVRRVRRAVGVRQVDAVAQHRRARGADRGVDRDRRPARSTTCRRRRAASRWCSSPTRSTRT